MVSILGVGFLELATTYILRTKYSAFVNYFPIIHLQN
jgi:hypothetical protein